MKQYTSPSVQVMRLHVESPLLNASPEKTMKVDDSDSGFNKDNNANDWLGNRKIWDE